MGSVVKANPLFTDSTKLHGDQIDTQIELNRVLLYDGETVSVIVKGHSGRVVKIPMQARSEFSYGAVIWLGYNESVSCQFIIEKNGQAVLVSPSRQFRARYAIVETWNPTFEESTPQLQAEPVPPNGTSKTHQAASYARSLIEKWGL